MYNVIHALSYPCVAPNIHTQVFVQKKVSTARMYIVYSKTCIYMDGYNGILYAVKGVKLITPYTQALYSFRGAI